MTVTAVPEHRLEFGLRLSWADLEIDELIDGLEIVRTSI